MKKAFGLILVLTLLSTNVFADGFGPRKLRLHEIDGSPDNYFYDLSIPNGSLTDNGDGTGALTFGGGTIGSAISGATAKYLLFTDGSGNLAQDTTGKIGYVDNVNHRLGIGTTAPGSGLVYGALQTQFHVSDGGGGLAIGAIQSTAGASLMYVEGFGQGLLAMADSNASSNYKIADFIYSAGKLSTRRLNDSYGSALATGWTVDYTVGDGSGYFGIGTVSPQDRLVVRPTTDELFAIGPASSVTGAVSVSAYNDTRTANVPMELRATVFAFAGGAGEKMRILDNGNVGIGTSAPQARLHIQTSGQDIRFEQTSGAGELAAGAAVYTANPAGGVLNILGDGTGTAGGKYALVYYSGLDNTFYSALEVANTTAIISRGILMLMKSGGCVGIGVTAPTATLSVSATSTTRASINIASGTAPTSPNNGDIWYDGTHMYGRVAGATKQLDN